MTAPAFTAWFTGLSGSGKSTLARALTAHLDTLSLRYQLLDGDELRRTLCRDLGYTKEDRDENVRRVAGFASELNRKDVVAVVALISPYRQARLAARQTCGRFVEIFVDCSIDTLIQRDTKGLYRRALAGELAHFSGVSDPYEAPDHPEIYINSGTQSEQASVDLLLSQLRKLGFLPNAKKA